jgi:hypothetical protein
LAFELLLRGQLQGWSGYCICMCTHQTGYRGQWRDQGGTGLHIPSADLDKVPLGPGLGLGSLALVVNGEQWTVDSGQSCKGEGTAALSFKDEGAMALRLASCRCDPNYA